MGEGQNESATSVQHNQQIIDLANLADKTQGSQCTIVLQHSESPYLGSVVDSPPPLSHRDEWGDRGRKGERYKYKWGLTKVCRIAYRQPSPSSIVRLTQHGLLTGLHLREHRRLLPHNIY
ncbi:hypothetical protein J6590_042899 [Homalodisca vitripennis]|nr:hypothetical protein J6590_042899 [Homalodisca vitripennis]